MFLFFPFLYGRACPITHFPNNFWRSINGCILHAVLLIVLLIGNENVLHCIDDADDNTLASKQ